jgi:hypothetical protein
LDSSNVLRLERVYSLSSERSINQRCQQLDESENTLCIYVCKYNKLIGEQRYKTKCKGRSIWTIKQRKTKKAMD